MFLQLIKKLFTPRSYEYEAQRAINYAKREILNHDTTAIYHKKMSEYYQESLTAVEQRLTTF